jgi:hypothetical protein
MATLPGRKGGIGAITKLRRAARTERLPFSFDANDLRIDPELKARFDSCGVLRARRWNGQRARLASQLHAEIGGDAEPWVHAIDFTQSTACDGFDCCHVYGAYP